jgi:DUF971 family protein
MPAPTAIEVDRERGVTLNWPDGHTTFLHLPQLRASCPCALCRNARESGGPSWPAPPGAADRIRVTEAELVGNWGLQLRWSDGHQTGIYPWSLLRSWCACEECAAAG